MIISFKKWIQKIINKKPNNPQNEESILVKISRPRSYPPDSQKKESILVGSSRTRSSEQKPKRKVLIKEQ